MSGSLPYFLAWRIKLDLSFMSCTSILSRVFSFFFVHVRMIVFIGELNRFKSFFRFLPFISRAVETSCAEFQWKEFLFLCLAEIKLQSLHFINRFKRQTCLCSRFWTMDSRESLSSPCWISRSNRSVNRWFSSDFHDDVEHQLEISAEEN